jgi:DNA-binding transcriptional MerR regulator
MTTTRPVQEFYSIGEVCTLTDLKPHVLRYWESQFRFLNPAKNHLLYTEKFTIDGARQRIDHYRRTGELRVSARRAFETEMAQEVRTTLEEVLGILDGKPIKRGSGAGEQQGSNSTPSEPKA